jgi:hypothetical protein
MLEVGTSETTEDVEADVAEAEAAASAATEA